VLPGPAPGLDALVGGNWRVGPNSDRVGIRLDGPPIEPGRDGELLSHGVVQGAIQVPAGGGPIILLADGQPTGGYPVIAVVVTADHPRLGQLRPGDRITFAATTQDDARAALAAQRAALVAGARLLRESTGWDDLWRSAGG
jgi:allophanate hydrolase subunit 2